MPTDAFTQFVKQLQIEDPTLSYAHAERIAALEIQLKRARRDARADPITGLLNERAVLEDEAAAKGTWMVIDFADLQVVYDRCGHESGNALARDLAKIMDEASRCFGVTLYRVATAKFAAFAVDDWRVKAFGDVIEALKPKDRTPGDPRSPLQRALDSSRETFGAKVRLKIPE